MDTIAQAWCTISSSNASLCRPTARYTDRDCAWYAFLGAYGRSPCNVSSNSLEIDATGGPDGQSTSCPHTVVCATTPIRCHQPTFLSLHFTVSKPLQAAEALVCASNLRYGTPFWGCSWTITPFSMNRHTTHTALTAMHRATRWHSGRESWTLFSPSGSTLCDNVAYQGWAVALKCQPVFRSS